jgi:putative ATP-dependent endonuclease of the OLD family
VISALGEVYKDPTTILEAKADLESLDVARYGKRVLTMAANQGKGWFAILLGQKIDHETVIPKYIVDAVSFAHPDVAKEVWFNVLSFRLHHIAESGLVPVGTPDAFRLRLDAFAAGKLDFADIRTEMLTAFTADRINAILECF